MGFQVRLRAIQWYRKETLQSIQQPRRFSRMSLNHQCPLLLPGWSFVSCCFSMQPSITLTVPQAILNYCFLVGWLIRGYCYAQNFVPTRYYSLIYPSMGAPLRQDTGGWTESQSYRWFVPQICQPKAKNLQGFQGILLLVPKDHR